MSSALVFCGGGEQLEGKYENTRAGCRSRKQIIDSREGRKGSGLAGKLSECARFNPFKKNSCILLLSTSHRQY